MVVVPRVDKMLMARMLNTGAVEEVLPQEVNELVRRVVVLFLVLVAVVLEVDA